MKKLQGINKYYYFYIFAKKPTARWALYYIYKIKHFLS